MTTTSPTIRDIRPAEFPWFRYDGYTFSLGLTDGENAWLSGHSASEHDPDSGRMVVRGGMADQTRTAYAKIAAILEAADLSWQDVTKVTENVTITGIEAYAEAEQVRRDTLGAHSPVVSTTIVDSLLRPAALIEIEVHATRGGGTALQASSGAGWDRRGVREGHDGEVLLPTILPVDERGEVVHQGDFVGQYAYCLDKADRLLNGVGLSLDAAVSTYDFSTPETREVYRKSHRVRKDRLGGAGVFPGAGGILMSRLHTPEVLVAMEITANRLPLTGVNPGWSRYDTLTYTPGVRAGRTLYMSGFASLDMESQEVLHPGDVVAQAETTYGAIMEVLEAAGGGPENLTGSIEFVSREGLADYRGVAKVRERLLKAPYPASTGAICGGLLRPEFLLEVFPSAVLDG
ncbi:RidA family protein [Ornithinimicrobium faecis]|uniref:RidA family protein n=1 Tax=Ornithinimicrobium faecis TaxID=2934158 RepID=UPI002118ABCF|nr:RidA family protein [Ornithinimicrobium sp. HY1745]